MAAADLGEFSSDDDWFVANRAIISLAYLLDVPRCQLDGFIGLNVLVEEKQGSLKVWVFSRYPSVLISGN